MIGYGTNRGASLWMAGAIGVGAAVLIAGAGSSSRPPAPLPSAVNMERPLGTHDQWGPTAFLAPPKEEEDDNKPVDPDSPTGSAEGPPLRKLTPEEINRIRFLELRAFRGGKEDKPDRVTVKLSRDTIESFVKKDMKETPEYRGVADDPELKAKLEKDQQEFRKMPAPMKLHYLAKLTGKKYMNEIKIVTDPEIFVDFKKWVMPQVLKTCATAECHGSTNGRAPIFRLFNETRRSPETMYANFIVLNELNVEERPDTRGGPLIDRDYPDESLLLKYLMDPKQVAERDRHPGGVKYRPAFNSEGALAFKRTGEWIGSLRHPAEDYGAYILRQPEESDDEDKAADTQPAEKAAGAGRKMEHNTGARDAEEETD